MQISQKAKLNLDSLLKTMLKSVCSKQKDNAEA